MAKFSRLSFLIIIACFLLSTSAHAARGSGYARVFAFGDSLTDGGTYTPAAGPKGGGKFTTNPGKIWVEIVSDHFGLTITPNRFEGFGSPLQLLGGGNYAQGGALLKKPGPPSTAPAASSRPVSEQLSYFVSEHKNFAATDLVLLQGGANDNFTNFGLVGEGKMTAADAVAASDAAAKDLVSLATEMVRLGATRVIVLNLPALDLTPLGLAQTPAAQHLLATLTDTFNAALATGAQAMTNITLVDLHAFDANFNVNYKLLGFATITSVACTNGSSLFCSGATLAVPNADMTYKFADSIHPTTGYSQRAAEFIYRAISAAP